MNTVDKPPRKRHRVGGADLGKDRGMEAKRLAAAILEVLAGARMCVERSDGTFRIGGVDLDGSPLSLVVSIGEGGAVVVTAEGDQ